MLPLSNGKSVLRLILIIHKSWDLKYFIHALKISWTKATYIKVSRNSQLQPNLAFGRIQRKLHSHRSPHLNRYFRAPKHKTCPHDLSITSFEAIQLPFFLSYKVFTDNTLVKVNPFWPSAPWGRWVLVCCSILQTNSTQPISSLRVFPEVLDLTGTWLAQ